MTRDPTMTLLSNGKVLIAGGNFQVNFPLASAQLSDPASGTWSATGSLIVARTDHTASLLANGRMLIAGGFSGSANLASAELYDPVSGIRVQAETLEAVNAWYQAARAVRACSWNGSRRVIPVSLNEGAMLPDVSRIAVVRPSRFRSPR